MANITFHNIMCDNKIIVQGLDGGRGI